MRKIAILTFALLTGLASSASAATTYTGSLSVGNGLAATELWNNPATTFSYVVSYNSGTGLWDYSYTLSVPAKNISHFIVEASSSFTAADISKVTWSVIPAGSYVVGNNAVVPANTYMPADLYGIKFTPGATQNVTVSFSSDRAPVWGDVYGRCGFSDGILNTIHNVGFTASDTDPSTTDIPLGDNLLGSLTYHILVPDTIPEPLTLCLLALGAAGVVARRRGIAR